MLVKPSSLGKPLDVELPSSQESGRGFTLRVGSRSASSGGDVVILHTRVHHQSENHKWPKATSDFCSDLHEWCVKLLHHDCIIEVQITNGRRPRVMHFDLQEWCGSTTFPTEVGTLRATSNVKPLPLD